MPNRNGFIPEPVFKEDERKAPSSAAQYNERLLLNACALHRHGRWSNRSFWYGAAAPFTGSASTYQSVCGTVRMPSVIWPSDHLPPARCSRPGWDHRGKAVRVDALLRRPPIDVFSKSLLSRIAQDREQDDGAHPHNTATVPTGPEWRTSSAASSIRFPVWYGPRSLTSTSTFSVNDGAALRSPVAGVADCDPP
jgi:hypothetical protein